MPDKRIRDRELAAIVLGIAQEYHAPRGMVRRKVLQELRAWRRRL